MMMARSKIRNCSWYFVIFMAMYIMTIVMIQLQTGLRQTGKSDDLDLISAASNGNKLPSLNLKNYKILGSETVKVTRWQAELPTLSLTGNDGAHHSGGNYTNYKSDSVKFIRVGDIYVYGVYLDTRLGNESVVRILALHQLRLNDGLMCRFFNNKKFIVFAEKYQMCENHGKKFGGWIYSCFLPSHVKQLPTTVHLSTVSEAFWDSMDYPQLELSLLQYSNDHHNNKDLIGVCVPPLFGNISLQTLVNYVELMKILGISKIFFYKMDISKSTENLLKYYEMNGVVKVYDWTLPANVSNYAVWYNGQLLAIQHCLYDNMADFQFLIFIDLDEMLIPKKTTNLLSMLHSVTREKTIPMDKISAFSFQSAFFDSRQLPDPTQKISLFQQLERTKKTSRVRTKLVVLTSQIYELGIHHVSRPIRDNVTVVDVDPTTALIHHYRKCIVVFDPNMRCFPTIHDDSALRYSEMLEKNSNNVMKEILQFIY